MSKIESAKRIYQRVMDPEFNAHGKSLRAAFIELAVAELAMTQSGANTYFQNLKNEAETGQRYKYRSPTKSKQQDMRVPQDPATAALDKVQAQLRLINRNIKHLMKQQEVAPSH